MEIYRQDGVCVRYSTVEDSQVGVMAVTYTGLISAGTFIDLWWRQVERTKDAPAIVVRFDGACLLFAEAPVPLSWSPPASMIVRADQMEFAECYSTNCARANVLRVAFLPEQESAALQWAESFGRENIEQSHSWRRRRPESDFAPLR